ncbi:MAG: PDDEXK nuclease domain-containing protein [Micropruina sp.]|uniref:PDDEXK nuclease domain-containing protein n=1 Tax=Micropruina sp. TaxID=2737536 RepID=UPI0039E4302D
MAELSKRVPPQPVEEVPEGYERWLADVAARVRSTQVRIARGANAEMIRLYWSIGRDILDRRDRQGWGARVIERLSSDLQREFPGRMGFSVTNLNYMRAMVAAWPSADAIPPRFVEELPWGHVRALLDGLEDVGDRQWYARMAIEQGWSRDVLRFQIQNRLRSRAGVAPSNFADVLPPQESDLAQQLTKDPYLFDVAALTERLSEHDLEQSLMDRLQHTLLELGRGMALAGRQVRLTVDGVDRFVDLLLFHVEQLRYVVIELKISEFEPEHMGQLSTYVAMVDDLVRNRKIHAPTVGLVLCTGKRESTVRYALAGAGSPVAVAQWQALPTEARAALPTAEELQTVVHAELAHQMAVLDPSTAFSDTD